MSNVNQVNSAHFIGIGGCGMSSVALIALDQGMKITGSDLSESGYTRRVRDAGATVFIGHDASQLKVDGEYPDVVVVTSAIPADNPEYREAKRLGIPIWHRAQMLARLGHGLKTVAICGTHGKTTSSSMMATILDELGYDPTFVIGGTLNAYETNARPGKGEYYVVEADESDKSFMYLSPWCVLLTNAEPDHLNHYEDLDEIYSQFAKFIAMVPEGGHVAVNGSDPRLMECARAGHGDIVTYGTDTMSDFWVSDFKPKNLGSTFLLHCPDGRVLEGSIPNNPGIHNVINASGVVACVSKLGVDPADALAVIARFKGVHRRYDIVGVEAGVTVVDDYAHHPTAVAATLKAARTTEYPRIHALFQPHRFSRYKLVTEVMRPTFAHAFDLADEVTFMDVDPSSDPIIPGVDGQSFLDVVLENPNHPPATYIADRSILPDYMASRSKPGDLIVMMSCGDITLEGPRILKALREHRDEILARGEADAAANNANQAETPETPEKAGE